MALLRYLQRKDGLPDRKGSLSSTIPPQAIARANQEVQAATQKEVQVREKGKRGAYHRYSPGEATDIGRYTSQHGVAVAARFFSRKLKSTVGETTVRSIKAAYPSLAFPGSLSQSSTFPISASQTSQYT